MTKLIFDGNFTQQEAIPETAINAAVDVMQSGRLHRYNTAPGEASPTMQLEAAYAAWQGVEYCLATASGGQAIQIAMRAAGVKADDNVLTNAFTLAPVPGAIAALGATPIFVETDSNLRLDLMDLAGKITRSGARYLLLSHMRGHLCDMDALIEITKSANISVIEDCAHTMGARWNGIRSGNFGLAGCFSAQTYKHINSGEGGLLTSDDPEFMARAIIYSGSYMLYERHGAAPPAHFFTDIRLETPNLSARMDNLRASLLIPQLESIEENITRWNARYGAVENELRKSNIFNVPDRPANEEMVGSSIQFRISHFDAAACQ